MYTLANPFYLVCESPLHAGSGSDSDLIDNPIQREGHTGFPKVEASSLKGALREAFYQKLKATNEPDLISCFGPDNPEPDDARQGSLGFADARLLLFPVKSMKGVFAWITCPGVLERWVADVKKTAGNGSFDIQNLVAVQRLEQKVAIVFDDKALLVKKLSKDEEKNKEGYAGEIVLEEFAFKTHLNTFLKVGTESLPSHLANLLFPADKYWHDKLKTNLVIVADEVFSYFVELSTEVITRTKISSETGTVEQGHLFTEEYLPTDAVLYSLVMAHREFTKNDNPRGDRDMMNFFSDGMKLKLKNHFQLGGNATLGKGLVRCVLPSNSSNGNGKKD